VQLSWATKSCTGGGFETLRCWLGEVEVDALFLHSGPQRAAGALELARMLRLIFYHRTIS